MIGKAASGRICVVFLSLLFEVEANFTYPAGVEGVKDNLWEEEKPDIGKNAHEDNRWLRLDEVELLQSHQKRSRNVPEGGY